MLAASRLIQPKRLRWLPKEARLAHEYCFFLHDELARMLVEYEEEDAHQVSVLFTDKEEGTRFKKIARTQDGISALRELDRHSEARRVILNTITMAMASDCAHHLYEALRCFEKRKFVPAFNLLRKPLLDHLTYFSWIVADEDDFYAAFASGDPAKLTQKMIGNRRKDLLAAAIAKTDLVGIVTADEIVSTVFDPANKAGLYKLFQHAVHLVTVERIEIRTFPENFNFIFKDPFDDDMYEALYSALPMILLYLAHVGMILFERIKPMDESARKAFVFRTISVYRFLQYEEAGSLLAVEMKRLLSPALTCSACSTPLKITHHNVARLLLTDSYRCTRCRRVSPFPLSWMF